MNEKQTLHTKQTQATSSSLAEPSQVQMVRPTKKQQELLAFIERFISEHGYSPSYREIMHGLQYNSVATVALHVSSLIKRGHLVKRDHSARSLEVVNPSGLNQVPLLTNQVKDAEEKWLVGKVEKLFADIESSAIANAQQLEDIATVLAAMRVLGLEGAALSFAVRQSALRSGASD